MQLKRLKAFHTVARLQSFSAATAVTKLSQPTLSRLIKQLEDDIGVELIDRYHRPLQLTAAGAFFFEKIDGLLKELNSAITLTQKIAHPTDVLNIGFVPSVLYGLLPAVISALKQRLPTLEVHLKDISSFQQIDALKSGIIDVSFARFAHTDATINQLLLRHERYVAAVPKNHPVAKDNKQHLSLSELQDEKLILYHKAHLKNLSGASASAALSTSTSLLGDMGASHEPLLTLFAKQMATPHHTKVVSDIQIALGLVAAGEGITLVPASLVSVRPEQISYHSLVHEDATLPIYICYHRQHPHPAFNTLLEVIYNIYETRGITYRRLAVIES